MPTFKPLTPFAPDAPIGETLLVETAIRIELPPRQHKTAVDRYEAVRKHIEREGSPLHGKVVLFYPQGSMAIGATIKSHWRTEGYDIDIIAELLLPHSTTPAQVLDLLYKAIRGEPGSRYYKMVKRQTRCVTIERGGSVCSDRILRKLSGSVCQFLSCFADHGHQVGRA